MEQRETETVNVIHTSCIDSEDIANEQDTKLLLTALFRSIYLLYSLENQLTRCSTTLSKQFLQRVIDKKKGHLGILEELAKKYGSPITVIMDNPFPPAKIDSEKLSAVGDNLSTLFDVIYKMAVKELNCYINHAVRESHPIKNIVLLTLVELSNEFVLYLKKESFDHQSEMLEAASSGNKIRMHAVANY